MLCTVCALPKGIHFSLEIMEYSGLYPILFPGHATRTVNVDFKWEANRFIINSVNVSSVA